MLINTDDISGEPIHAQGGYFYRYGADSQEASL